MAPPLIHIRREPDDPVALRASIGGRGEGLGYYLVFRGDPDAVLDMLRHVLKAAEIELPKRFRGPSR